MGRRGGKRISTKCQVIYFPHVTCKVGSRINYMAALAKERSMAGHKHAVWVDKGNRRRSQELQFGTVAYSTSETFLKCLVCLPQFLFQKEK